MQTNYLSNNNQETITAIADAINYEKYDMLLSLNSDAQKKQTSIISSENSTEDEIIIAKNKLEKLQSDADDLREKQVKTAENYKKVLETVANTSNEFTKNDADAFRNVLRLSACDENSKFFKLAIITACDNFGELYNGLTTLHDMESENIENNGLRTYTKAEKETADKLEESIQGLLKTMFSISLENEYTRKINVKFNKTDMNIVHETFVTGLTVDMNKSRKTSKTTVEGLSFKYAIEKVEKDGKTEYKGSRFKETVAKIAFSKLFKK